MAFAFVFIGRRGEPFPAGLEIHAAVDALEPLDDSALDRGRRNLNSSVKSVIAVSFSRKNPSHLRIPDFQNGTARASRRASCAKNGLAIQRTMRIASATVPVSKRTIPPSVARGIVS
jgi:hypothetical protein